MTEKTKNKYLENLEKYLAGKNPALLQATKIFHELDQIEYDMGLIEMDESTASKVSWWPIITLIGAPGSGKGAFINRYLNAQLFQPGIQEKLTVLQYSQTEQAVTLPGTALDGDPRFPFYHISEKLEGIRRGAGARINSYLELKSITNNRVQDKILINSPDLTDLADEIALFLTQHVLRMSDLVLVFLQADTLQLDSLQAKLQKMFEQENQLDPNKILYVINQQQSDIDNVQGEQTLSLLKAQLNDSGIQEGQIIILDNAPAPAPSSSVLNQIAGKQGMGAVSGGNASLALIEERMASVNVHRAYEILHELDHTIRELEERIIPEIREAIMVWKDRVHFTDTIILGFIVSLLVFAEINTGIVLATLVDPLMLSITLAVLFVFIVPLHIIASKAHAKFMINNLNMRKKHLGLLENLAGVFEKHLSFWFMLLPKKEPLGWNKKTKARLTNLLQKTQDLVQSLNDGFSGGYRGR